MFSFSENKTDQRWKVPGLVIIPSIILFAAYRVIIPGSVTPVTKIPVVMAALNTISTGLLCAAYVNIRSNNVERHKKLNLMALTTSLMFLTSYAVYHYYQVAPVHYTGDFRGIYYFILITHIPLAAAIVPLAAVTVLRGLNGKTGKHRRIARITLPLWLYVSVTGVIIYLMVN